MDIKTLAAGLNDLAPLSDQALNESPLNKISNSLAERINSYYRSKLFISSTGINPLLASASAFISIVEKLSLVETVPDLYQLQQNLIHELKAFQHRAQSSNYRSQIIFAARYILCTWADERINNLKWEISNHWQQFSLCKALQNDSLLADQFFLLLERCCQDPAIYIDLLEVFYVCLALGYEGEFRNQARGNNELSTIQDHLYTIIRQQRGDFSKKLLIEVTNNNEMNNGKKIDSTIHNLESIQPAKES